MEKPELEQTLRGKYILLDTDVLICLIENFDKVKDFIAFIKNIDCVFVYFPLIEFEFTRGAYKKEHRDKREKFLKMLSINNLPFRSDDDETIKETIKVAHIYASKKMNPSLIDCCTAAYLKKYSQNLFLATLNHKHFPTFLFDRFYIWTIDSGRKEIYPIGLYRFNKEKELTNCSLA